MSSALNSIPATTSRPVIFNHDAIPDELIIKYLGKPQKAVTKCQPRTEVVVPIAQALKDKQFRRVHSLVCIEHKFTVSIGGMPPQYSDSSEISIGSSCRQKIYRRDVPRVTYMQYEGTECCNSDYSCGSVIEINSKNGTTFDGVYNIDKEECALRSVTMHDDEDGNLLTSTRWIDTFGTGKLVAFDGSSSKEKFVLVEEVEIRKTKKRIVRLYKLDNKKCLATYTPPTKTFEPTDVCFWHFEDEDKLLIADWQNDAIHVVDTKDDDLKFERYLAPGSGHLFKPTALNVDEKGFLSAIRN
jgi:hypothetical protein